MKIIDISIALNNSTIVYPGNTSVSIDVFQKMPKHNTQVSSITFGSHTGTHIDAPAHAILGGKTLDKIPLNIFIGKCRVLDFSKEKKESITKKMLENKKIKKGERILLKTKNSFRIVKDFYDDYVYLDGDAADYLAKINVLLLGIDALSIKKRGGVDNRAHTSLLKKNIPIIEGLNLKLVKEKTYELICLPLNFTDIDGSPARAILIEK